jgi:hypothetical protein
VLPADTIEVNMMTAMNLMRNRGAIMRDVIVSGLYGRGWDNGSMLWLWKINSILAKGGI